MKIKLLTPLEEYLISDVKELTFESADGQRTLYDQPMDLLVEVRQGSIIIDKTTIFLVKDGMFHIQDNQGVFFVEMFSKEVV